MHQSVSESQFVDHLLTSSPRTNRTQRRSAPDDPLVSTHFPAKITKLKRDICHVGCLCCAVRLRLPTPRAKIERTLPVPVTLKTSSPVLPGVRVRSQLSAAVEKSTRSGPSSLYMKQNFLAPCEPPLIRGVVIR